jgi:hypothetical protein
LMAFFYYRDRQSTRRSTYRNRYRPVARTFLTNTSSSVSPS